MAPGVALGVAGGLLVALVLAVPSPAAAQFGRRMQTQQGPTFWDDVVGGSQSELERVMRAAADADSRGASDEALRGYREALQIDESSIDAWTMALQTAFRTRPDVFDELLAQATGDPAMASRPQVLFFRGVQALRDGAWSEAIDALESATRYRSQLVDARMYYGNLAEAHMAAGHAEEAVFFYRQALADDAGYLHARAGLVLALLRAGRADDATVEAQRIVLADAQLRFLDEPGVFMVPEGDEYLLRAMVATVAQDAAQTEQWLGAWEGTPSAAMTSDAVRDAVLARASTDDDRVIRWAVPGCRPIRVEATPALDRVAVVCEGADVRMGEVRGDEVEWTRVTGYAHSVRPTDAAYSLTDIAWSSDGTALRILWSTSQVEEISVATGRTSGLHGYGNADLSAVGFDNSGEMVVFTSYYTSGLQLAPFDATNVVSSAGYLSTGVYPTRVRATSDGRRAGVLWDGGMQVFDTATWQYVGELTRGTSTTTTQELALLDDGSTVVYPRQGLLLVQGIGDTSPRSFVVLPHSGTDAVLAVDAVDAGTVVASVPDAVFVVRIR